jgi:hypothetical protein
MSLAAYVASSEMVCRALERFLFMARPAGFSKPLARDYSCRAHTADGPQALGYAARRPRPHLGEPYLSLTSWPAPSLVTALSGP